MRRERQLGSKGCRARPPDAALVSEGEAARRVVGDDKPIPTALDNGVVVDKLTGELNERTWPLLRSQYLSLLEETN